MHTAGAPFSNEEAQRDTAAACVGSPQHDTAAAGIGSPQHNHSEDAQVHCSCCSLVFLHIVHHLIVETILEIGYSEAVKRFEFDGQLGPYNLDSFGDWKQL